MNNAISNLTTSTQRELQKVYVLKSEFMLQIFALKEMRIDLLIHFPNSNWIQIKNVD